MSCFQFAKNGGNTTLKLWNKSGHLVWTLWLCQGCIKVGWAFLCTHRPYSASKFSTDASLPPGVFCFHVHPALVVRFHLPPRAMLCACFFWGFIMLYRGGGVLPGSWPADNLYAKWEKKKKRSTTFLTAISAEHYTAMQVPPGGKSGAIYNSYGSV